MNSALSARLAQFKDALAAAGLDGAVVSKPENVFYLTGVGERMGRPVFAVVGPQRAAVVAPAGATPTNPNIDVYAYGVPGMIVDRIVDVDQDSDAFLQAAFEQVGLRASRVGFEDSAMSARHAASLALEATFLPLHGEIEALRQRKNVDELALVREAIRCNEAGFAAAQHAIRPDVSEFDVYLAVARAVEEAAGAALSLGDGNHAFISGPRTALIAGQATDRPLRPGDLMIIDLNPVIRYYKGDITRTFCVGVPTAAQQSMHDSIVRALDCAMKAGRPGARGRDVDAALREPLVEAGYGQWLTTHFGHGLGLQHLERPYIIPAEDMRLEEGMVIALEPGVYVPDSMGIRVEDNYVVTPTGLEPLSHYPRELGVASS